MPGAVIARIEYLWPKRGQVWASARRRDDVFAHFVLATGFWGFLIFLAPGFLAGLTHRNPARVASTPAVAGPAPAGAEAAARAPDRISGGSETAASQPSELDRRSTDDVASPVDGLPTTTVAFDPASSDAVAVAVAAAVREGQPRRWHDDGHEGFAVPSESATAGCRNVLVSVDGRDELASTKQVCGLDEGVVPVDGHQGG